MPSLAHEIAVARLSRDPSLLHALAEKLLGMPASPALRPVDSALRLANPEEVRPDLILAWGKRGPWDAVEIQRRIDRVKARRWAILVGLLHDQRRCMGDLWVITASRRAAAWASRACHVKGPRGTVLRVKPIVLYLSLDQVNALLDDGRPSLAFFAAWAMQDRHGTKAAEVVERAFSVTDGLSKALRREQERDILSVLNQRMLGVLKERIMEAGRDLESRWVKQLKEDLFGGYREQFKAEGRVEGKSEGKQEALLAVLKARGLPVSPSARAKVLACVDPATLDRWLARAVTAASTKDVLGPASRRPAKRAPARTTAKNGRAARHA